MMQKLRTMIASRTGKLALTYLAIIMALTLVFSFILFETASAQLDKPHNQNDFGGLITQRDIFDTYLEQRALEAKEALIWTLVILNLGVLVAGAWFSWYLARSTMAPIEQSMQAQSEFVSDASHELRTPLTVLQTNNEVALRKKKLTLDDAKLVIEQNVSDLLQLQQLTNALLGLLKEDREAPKLKAIDTQTPVQDALQFTIPAAQHRNIEIVDKTQPVTAIADAAAISSVIKIFLDNAVKYSEDGSNITVQTRSTQKHVDIQVIDTGVGIPSEQLDRIFDRFYRSDKSRSSQHVEGFGLGLAIAKKVCDQRGWQIVVRSKPGKGSTFTLRMNAA